jgi:SAM-dependent methyltransferase
VHPSAYEFATTALTGPDVEHMRVVETGAYDYNGSVRDAILKMVPLSYVGTDCQPGPGVDLVCPAEKLPEALGEGAADVVISTEMLEHAEDWQAAMAGMVRVLAPGGTLLLTTRSAGFPYHPHPGDFWRYSVDLMRQIAVACGLDILRLEADQPASPGVFLLARKPAGWDGTGMAEALSGLEPGPPR